MSPVHVNIDGRKREAKPSLVRAPCPRIAVSFIPTHFFKRGGNVRVTFSAKIRAIREFKAGISVSGNKKLYETKKGIHVFNDLTTTLKA